MFHAASLFLGGGVFCETFCRRITARHTFLRTNLDSSHWDRASLLAQKGCTSPKLLLSTGNRDSRKKSRLKRASYANRSGLLLSSPTEPVDVDPSSAGALDAYRRN